MNNSRLNNNTKELSELNQRLNNNKCMLDECKQSFIIESYLEKKERSDYYRMLIEFYYIEIESIEKAIHKTQVNRRNILAIH